MIAPSYPKYVDEALKSIDQSFHLRWNPNARVIKMGHYAADGSVVPPVTEPRYEVWAKDSEGQDYRVMLVDRSGNYAEPSQWLLDHLNRINPARYDGDIGRMIAATIDKENNHLREIADRDWKEYTAALGRWYFGYGKTQVTKTKDGL